MHTFEYETSLSYIKYDEIVSLLLTALFIRQIKKISAFRVTGLKILGMVCTHVFFLIVFCKILCILKGISPFKMHKNSIFSRKPEKRIIDTCYG